MTKKIKPKSKIKKSLIKVRHITGQKPVMTCDSVVNLNKSYTFDSRAFEAGLA